MAKILVIDDLATNRQILLTILKTSGHTVLEAADGEQGLSCARTERPDLIITDIVVPRIDGYQLTCELRADPHLARIPVIFYTGNAFMHEAEMLSDSLGTAVVLKKPSSPERILGAVEALLGVARAEKRPDYLVKTESDAVLKLRQVGLRLGALVELAVKLGSERDPLGLLEGYATAACRIFYSRYAAVGVLDDDCQALAKLVRAEYDSQRAEKLTPPKTLGGIFRTLIAGRQPIRLTDATGEPAHLGLPADHPPVTSLLGAPIVTAGSVYGALYVADVLDRREFTEEDERLAVTLGNLIGIAYENVKLIEELKGHSERLKSSERRSRLIIESTWDAFFCLDDKSRIVDWSPQAEALFGWSDKDVSGKGLSDIVAAPQAQAGQASGVEDFLSTTTREGISKRMELIAVRRDGSELPIELTVFPVDSEGRHTLYAFAHDVSERKRAEQMARAARERDDFVATAIHDLRTPLIGAQRTLDMLLKRLDKQAYPEEARLIARLAGSTSELVAMVGALLDVFRYDSGAQDFHFQEVDLAQLSAQCLEEMSQLAAGRSLSLQTDPKTEQFLVPGDFMALKRVLTNLLSNAIKFTDESGAIEIALERDDGRVRLTVSDTGQGIAPQDQATLFQRFRTGSVSEPKGSGLGLFLSRRIVEAHKGSISCQSQVGKGSSFTVVLPALLSPSLKENGKADVGAVIGN